MTDTRLGFPSAHPPRDTSPIISLYRSSYTSRRDGNYICRMSCSMLSCHCSLWSSPSRCLEEVYSTAGSTESIRSHRKSYSLGLIVGTSIQYISKTDFTISC